MLTSAFQRRPNKQLKTTKLLLLRKKFCDDDEAEKHSFSVNGVRIKTASHALTLIIFCDPQITLKLENYPDGACEKGIEQKDRKSVGNISTYNVQLAKRFMRKKEGNKGISSLWYICGKTENEGRFSRKVDLSGKHLSSFKKQIFV